MPSHSKEAVELYNLGLNLARQDRHEDAIQPLVEALKADADYTNAYNLLGKIHIRLGDVQQAQECWTEVLRRDAFNSTAMACLEAATPKSLLERFRNVVPIVTVIVLVLGLIFVYSNIRQVDARLKAIEEKLGLGPVGTTQQPTGNTLSINNPKPKTESLTSTENLTNSQIINDTTFPTNVIPTNDSLTPNDSGIFEENAESIDVEPEFSDVEPESGNVGSQSIVEASPITSPFPIKSEPSPTQTTTFTPSSESHSIAAPVPKTVAELKARYSNALQLCQQDKKYAEAVREFRALTQSNLSHPWIIGNAHYWAGLCYQRLNQPRKALAEFRKVTPQNSRKYKYASEKIREIESQLGD